MHNGTDLVPAPAPIEEPELAERITRQSAVLLTICLSSVVAALAIIARFTPAPARPLIFPVEQAAAPRVQAISITPITSTADAASGLSFAGDAYDVTCTVSDDTVTLSAAAHDGSSWRVFDDTAKTLAVGSGRTARFPADRATGLRWNVLKAGAGSVASCTARQAFGPISRPPSSGGAPGLHAATHGNGEDDEVALDASQITGGTLDVARLPTAIPATSIADGSVSNAEFQFIGTVTSNVQTQIDGKLGTAGNGGSLTGVFAGFLSGGANTGINNGTTAWLVSPGDGVAAGTGVAPLFVAPFGTVTIGAMHCRTAQACGAGEQIVFTLQKSSNNGGAWSDTGNVCTISGATDVKCTAVATATAAADDLLAIQSVSSGACNVFNAVCTAQVSK